MAKREKTQRKKPSAAPKQSAALASESIASTQAATPVPLHELFARQAREMLDQTDLDEEQKQSLLVAMSCPCCGAGGMSYTVKLKR